MIISTWTGSCSHLPNFIENIFINSPKIKLYILVLSKYHQQQIYIGVLLLVSQLL